MMLNKRQLAEYLGIQRITLDRWIKQGLPCYKHEKTYRFDIEEVKEWMRKEKNK